MAKQKSTQAASASAVTVPQGFVGYEFRTKGRYITKKDEETKTRRVVTFEESILVPANALSIFDEVHTRNEGVGENGVAKVKTTEFRNYLGRLRKKLIPMKLAQRSTEFSAIREFSVIEVIGHGGADVVDLALPITMMSLSQLKQYCQFHSISKADIDPSAYIDVAELREDLWNYNEDKEAFRATASNRAKRRGAERAFMDLNTVNLVPTGGADKACAASEGRSAPLSGGEPDEDIL